MNKFVIEFDALQPSRPVYLGVGTNEINERLAVIAVQLIDPEIMVLTLDSWPLNRWAQDGQTGDLWPIDRDILTTALREVSGNATPLFFASTRDHTIRSIAGNEIIAAPSLDFPFRAAVCEVVGASAHHIPSQCIEDPAIGRPLARRLIGHLRPN